MLGVVASEGDRGCWLVVSATWVLQLHWRKIGAMGARRSCGDCRLCPMHEASALGTALGGGQVRSRQTGRHKCGCESFRWFRALPAS